MSIKGRVEWFYVLIETWARDSGIQSPQADIKDGNFSFIEAWKFYPVPIGFK